MAVKYGKFELPTTIKMDEATKKNNFLKIVAAPFERGFGHTIGNALRRVMLNSLEAPAIVSVRIEGVPHEYMAIDGIMEDMTNIILNLKGSLLRKIPTDDESGSRETRLFSKIVEVTPQQIEENNGRYEVSLRDIIDADGFEIVNPDHVIFVVTKPMSRKVDIKVAFGRGYVSSERLKNQERMVGEIFIDAAFSPVRLVNYYVEDTRVGQHTDYDRLVLEIVTDGRVTPEEALSFATQIGILHFEVFTKLNFQPITFDKGDATTDEVKEELMAKLALKISEIELSVRSTNCLAGASIETIGELVVMPESEMLKFRNFGKKSLTEIKAKLSEMGLSLGMDLSNLGITRDNVKDVMKEYMANRKGEEK